MTRTADENLMVYLNKTVFDAALERIRFVFQEYDNVVVSFSGGKDSTITFNLALMVAREMGRLPLKVLFLDQEAEWQATIDAVQEVMEHPDVDPYWIQCPFRLFNATSTKEHWLVCWEPGKEDLWMREKWPRSIKENNFGTERFKKMFSNMPKVLWPDQKTAFLAGVRAEESPARRLGITGSPAYKWATWGTVLGDRKGADEKGRYNVTFYPIYDWTFNDVWKAIYDNNWSYCRLYDILYQYGVSTTKMRVSNVHHETAVWSLFVLQEVEPKTYERLSKRIEGIDMAGKMGLADYFPKEVPCMFSGWREYRDFLLEKLIDNPDWTRRFKRMFSDMEDKLGDYAGEGLYKAQVTSILTNDWEGVKLDNFMRAPENYLKAKKTKKKRKGLQ